jgi:hypothetical protein
MEKEEKYFLPECTTAELHEKRIFMLALVSTLG